MTFSTETDLLRCFCSILEGLYVFLGEEPWRSAALRLDERIWVETSKYGVRFLVFTLSETDNAYIGRPEARERLVNRHLTEGVESTRAGAIRRGALLFASGLGKKMHRFGRCADLLTAPLQPTSPTCASGKAPERDPGLPRLTAFTFPQAQRRLCRG